MANYNFEIKDDVLFLHVDDGYYLPQRIRVASKENPEVVIDTNNMEDRSLITYLPRLKGAIKLVDEVYPNYDYDPYGRRVQRGTRPYQKWNVSEVFK